MTDDMIIMNASDIDTEKLLLMYITRSVALTYLFCQGYIPFVMVFSLHG